MARVAEAVARARDSSLIGCELALFADHDGGAPLEPSLIDPEAARLAETATPALLGQLYERLIDGDQRRRSGTHLTPLRVARELVARLEPDWLDVEAPTVLDPAVGGGAFLIAAADAMVAAGRAPHAAWRALVGVDIDPDALAVCDAALALWLLTHGESPAPHPQLRCGDALLEPLPSCDVVAGNPPFLNQLRRTSAASTERRAALKARLGDLVGSYTDDAWLFMAAGVQALRDGGQLVLVEPISLLAARHAGPIRRAVTERATMTGLWVADGMVFDASVEVCAPILRAETNPTSTPVRRWSGHEFGIRASAAEPGADGWGRLGAELVGIPPVVLAPNGDRLGDIAGATAGFRDQFYGFAPHVREHATTACLDDEPIADRLVTVGMIDPFQLRWGHAEFAFAGDRYRRPVLDRVALAAADPKLDAWVEARRRPKVLVATQTRVVEVWVDERGDAVPATPVIAVEPEHPERIFHVAALLSAPAVTAHLASATFGTAMSIRALKLAAHQLLELPLPVDVDAWDQAAESVRNAHDRAVPMTPAERRAFGETIDKSLGLSVIGLADWWADRWPAR